MIGITNGTVSVSFNQLLCQSYSIVTYLSLPNWECIINLGKIGTSPAAGQAGRTAATTGTVSDTRKKGKQMFRF